MIYCPNCGLANRDGSRFCNECGHRVFSYASCVHCGFPNPVAARFCSNCGGAPQDGPVGVAQEAAPASDLGLEELPLEVDSPDLSELLQDAGVLATPAPAERGATIPDAVPEFDPGEWPVPAEPAATSESSTVEDEVIALPVMMENDPVEVQSQASTRLSSATAQSSEASPRADGLTDADEDPPADSAQPEEPSGQLAVEEQRANDDDLPAIAALLEIPLSIEDVPEIDPATVLETAREAVRHDDAIEVASVVDSSHETQIAGDPNGAAVEEVAQPQDLPPWMIEGRGARSNDLAVSAANPIDTFASEASEVAARPAPVPGLALARSGRVALDAAPGPSAVALAVSAETGALFSRIVAMLEPTASSARPMMTQSPRRLGQLAVRLLVALVALVAALALLAVVGLTAGYLDPGALKLR